MTGAWKSGLQITNATSLGATTTGATTGTLLTSSSSTYTKGAWSQIIAATTTDIAWVLITGESVTSNGRAFGVDIGYGASGSETVAIANLLFSDAEAVSGSFFLPLCIQAGTRIAARVSSNSASDTFYLLLQGFQDTYQSTGVGSAVDTYGFSTSTNLGTPVDPGATANTKGAYSQIIASTTADIAGFMLYIDGQNTTTGSVGQVQWLVDLAVGASGSEVVILPNTYQVSYTNPYAGLFVQTQIYLPIQIAAGSRIAARAQCSVTASPDRLIGATVYGIRQ